jgi:hypothetical protein
MEPTIPTEDLKAKLDRKHPVKIVETLAPELPRSPPSRSVEQPPGTDQGTRSAVVAEQGC